MALEVMQTFEVDDFVQAESAPFVFAMLAEEAGTE